MIYLNQVGYNVDLPKKAAITGKGENCYVLSADGETTYTPKLSKPVFDPASNDIVRVADFSDIKEPGEYFLFSDGLKKTFYINEKPNQKLLAAMVKSMYYLRCGCALEEKHAGIFTL